MEGDSTLFEFPDLEGMDPVKQLELATEQVINGDNPDAIRQFYAEKFDSARRKLDLQTADLSFDELEGCDDGEP